MQIGRLPGSRQGRPWGASEDGPWPLQSPARPMARGGSPFSTPLARDEGSALEPAWVVLGLLNHQRRRCASPLAVSSVARRRSISGEIQGLPLRLPGSAASGEGAARDDEMAVGSKRLPMSCAGQQLSLCCNIPAVPRQPRQHPVPIGQAA